MSTSIQAHVDAMAASFERNAAQACTALIEASSPVTGTDPGALAWLAREARRQFADLRARADACDYGLVVAIASGAITWCEDRTDDPRLPRAVRAHANAIAMVVRARMRGDRKHDADALVSGLVLQLHELLRAG